MSVAILIVDDEPGIRDLLAWELGGEGHEITAAADGAEALERLQEKEFDLVISDVKMPRVGGLEVLRATKETAPDTEVVIATGYAELESAIECVRRGAFDFIQKPFRTAHLLDTVARALERRRLRLSARLHEASRTILGAQERQRLPELIIRLVVEAMEADDASLFLPDADGGLYVAHRHSRSPDSDASLGPRTGERVAGGTAALREPLVIRDGGSRIVYPLLAGERVVGMLDIQRCSGRRPFRKGDLERAGILASQILLALENARLIRQMASSERLASVGLLATGIVHEVSNPVASVLVNQSLLERHFAALGRVAGLLDTGAEAAEVRRAWESIGGAKFFGELREVVGDLGVGAGQIRDIAHDMKSLARGDESRAISFDANESIRSAVRITGAQVRHHAAVRTDLGTGLEVLGSPGRLSQVFVNLLLNAAQALADARDGRQHEIAIRSERRGGQVVVRVCDDGPGIRPEHLARIFETFFTTKGASSGTGLGLAISREIAQAHGGDLRVESTFGQGAAFILSLPYAGVAVEMSASQEAIAEPVKHMEMGPPARPRILFIDDERSILRTYERAFGQQCEVVLADGGAEALAILSRGSSFDLVVCDMLMPHVSGMDVFGLAREARWVPEESFLFVTGAIAQPEVAAFLRNAHHRVLEKPFAFSRLRQIITQPSITAAATR